MKYGEFAALTRNVTAVRKMARQLLRLFEEELSDCGYEFLNRLASKEWLRPLRDSEKRFLYSLYIRGGLRKEVGGYVACTVVQKLFDLRLDLLESQEEIIVDWHEVGPELALTENQWKFVFALCREHDLIHHWVSF